MKTKSETKGWKVKQIAALACFLIVVVMLLNWLFPRTTATVCGFVAVTAVKSAPRFAWRYGPPDLQSFAAMELAKQIYPSMTFEQVYDLVGKGALNGNQLKGRKLLETETISFNVRSWYNNGLDVTFTNGVVSAVFYYD